MADPKATDKKKVKRPSAQKRILQSQKRKLNNRSFKASVNTAIKKLDAAIAEKSAPEALQQVLNQVYSLVDKGVKKGVFKTQKGARTKSRLSSKVSA